MARARAGDLVVGDTVVDFLKSAVEAFGPRDAMLFKPGFRYQRWTYDRMWEESGKVAALLQRRGLTKGDQVLLWGPNSPQWVLAFFGCIRAGVVVVPLDLRSAPDYVERVVSKTSPKLAFTSRFTPKNGTDLAAPEVAFEDLEKLVHDLPQPEEVDTAADDLVEIMFTSGTTGDPKGVMLTHRNLTANIEGIAQYIVCGEDTRLLSILPLSHMYEQMGGLFVLFYYGASVTYPTSRQPTVLARTMRERRVTTMLLVPQGLELLMNSIQREVERQGKQAIWSTLLRVAEVTPFNMRRRLFRRVHKQFGGSLDFIVSGGAALDSELGSKWELLGVKIVQGYGATEASPVISNHTIDGRRPDSVGRPLPNVEVEIAADSEILVRGPNVTPGYWDAPDQTAAAFEDGWYKTGDQGYFDDEGFLHIQGRKKDMIVLPSGQNVFPEDVEAVLNRHPSVTEAVVVGLSKGSSVEVHAALILEDPGAAADAVSSANEQLAEQQRVRGFTVWPEEDFPRTHTLKVKKRQVMDTLMGNAPMVPAESSASGGGASETRGVRHIVADAAKRPLEYVSPGMMLGEDLDSLGRIELLSAIEAELGVYLDESQIGAETTVEELAALVEEGSKSPVMTKFPNWGMWWATRMARGLLQRLVLFPFIAVPYRLKVTDRQNLNGLDGPVLFACNHHLGMDNILLMKAVPIEWRRRLAIAAAAHLWSNPVRAVLNPLLGNGFPLAKDGPVRPSLENMGRIIDNGWSVLIYPEGELTVGGPMKGFMNGTGLVAVEGRFPVVPLRLHVHDIGSPRALPMWKRGRIEVRFGVPLYFAPGTEYQEATDSIESAVRAL